MRKIFVIILVLFFSLQIGAQEITGDWHGLLKVMGSSLRLVFHIEKTSDGYAGKMDSPDQNAYGIKISSVQFDGSDLILKIPELMLEYSGKPEKEIIKGNFRQGGITLPLELTREAVKAHEINRPQEPKPPFPYRVEGAVFENSIDKINLSGTLTYPTSQREFPAVILISGSGPQNRDEEVFGHKPFWILADHLTRNGIAVLRFDDRGTAQSEGNFATATSLDFANDVQAAVNYLKSRKEIDNQKIGLIGHSEGGIIAPMVAAGSDDIAFIVLLAGTGIPGSEILSLQQFLIGRANGIPENLLEETVKTNCQAVEIVRKYENSEELDNRLAEFLKTTLNELSAEQKPKGLTDDEIINLQVQKLANPWMKFFLFHDPATVLEKVKCPVLALNGEKDLQVPPVENLTAIEKALQKGGNKNYMVKKLPGLNHLFQECETGSPNEYFEIEQTFSPGALNEISTWINKIIKR